MQSGAEKISNRSFACRKAHQKHYALVLWQAGAHQAPFRLIIKADLAVAINE